MSYSIVQLLEIKDDEKLLLNINYINGQICCKIKMECINTVPGKSNRQQMHDIEKTYGIRRINQSRKRFHIKIIYLLFLYSSPCTFLHFPRTKLNMTQTVHKRDLLMHRIVHATYIKIIQQFNKRKHLRFFTKPINI